GPGDDQVLFLGGDLDRNGRPVPDSVAIRYNTLLHRYEFTSLLWDIANQRFVTDPNGQFAQNFIFYQTQDVEHTVIDTRAGDDVAGNVMTPPDRYESVVRHGTAGRNDDFNFASYIGPIAANQLIDNLNLNFGDNGDWYILNAPSASNRFGQTQTGWLTREMIDVTFGGVNYNDYFLFAAQPVNPADPLSLVPIEQFTGVPSYYLLHVVNINKT